MSDMDEDTRQRFVVDQPVILRAYHANIATTRGRGYVIRVADELPMQAIVVDVQAPGRRSMELAVARAREAGRNQIPHGVDHWLYKLGFAKRGVSRNWIPSHWLDEVPVVDALACIQPDEI